MDQNKRNNIVVPGRRYKQHEIHVLCNRSLIHRPSHIMAKMAIVWDIHTNASHNGKNGRYVRHRLGHITDKIADFWVSHIPAKWTAGMRGTTVEHSSQKCINSYRDYLRARQRERLREVCAFQNSSLRRPKRSAVFNSNAKENGGKVSSVCARSHADHSQLTRRASPSPSESADWEKAYL